jgi:AraC family transcriptional regulator of adaptative response/methylated-DNA-[protein]-cysteine methyltransferase
MNNTARTPQSSPAIVDDPRWAQILGRDPQAEGAFYYSVRTTGVYCRPSCPSRRPRPENVRFHATRVEAEQAGFRPCRRCHPDQPTLAEQHAAIIAESCRAMAAADREPRLDELAAHAGMSPFYFHRLFKQISGLTPKEYWTAQREQRVRDELVNSRTVTEAIYSAGYHSNSRFYAKSKEVLGMTPTNFRLGGANMKISFAIGECSLGAILVAMSERGLCAIFLGDDPEVLVRELQGRFPRADLIGGDGEFELLVAQVVGFVEMPGLGLDLPLDVRGTAFQQRVWQALRQIPPGQTATYAEIADRIGAPKSVRAVGQACGANPLAVVIPCHRVVRTDGGLAGYHWGVERKQALLEKESRLAPANSE